MSSQPSRIAQYIRTHGHGWLMSFLLHLAVLGPLCMITWAVASGTAHETLLSLSSDLPVGESGDGTDDALGANGAAGNGKDRAAPGIQSEALSAPPAAPVAQDMGDVGAAIASLRPTQETGGSAEGINSALVRNLVSASEGRSGAEGGGGAGDLLRGTSAGFGDYVGTLRGKGLDVVLVLDATDSMSPFINQAKQRLRQVLDVVVGLVPNARIGVVAYKDYCDDYGPTACRTLKIGSDPNVVRVFLDSVVAGGGGDEPEPLNEALKAATDNKLMGWIGGRKHVIILVGDSTCHPSGRQEAFRLAKDFARLKGTINVIDTGGAGEQAAKREAIQPDLQQIAKDGGGSAFLLTDEKAFWQHMIVSVFGDRYKQDVDVIIAKFVRKETP